MTKERCGDCIEDPRYCESCYQDRHPDSCDQPWDECDDVLAERDAAVALGKRLAKALDACMYCWDRFSVEDSEQLLAEARERGWL